jgi:hypothetical protein
MKIPFATQADVKFGGVDVAQSIVDKYAMGLVEINMAYEKKYNQDTHKEDIIPIHFSFIPKVETVKETLKCEYCKGTGYDKKGLYGTCEMCHGSGVQDHIVQVADTHVYRDMEEMHKCRIEAEKELRKLHSRLGFVIFEVAEQIHNVGKTPRQIRQRYQNRCRGGY